MGGEAAVASASLVHSADATSAGSVPRSSLAECHECGRFARITDLRPGQTARCIRCGAVLRRSVANSLDRTLAFSIAGLVLMAVAATAPFMSMRIEGRVQDANLITGAIELVDRGLWPLGILVVITTIAAPLAKLGLAVYVIMALKLRRPPRHLPFVFRSLEMLTPWAMVEVYLLGIFVAYVKLTDLATIQLGVALYSFMALMLIVVAANASLDDEAAWREMARRGLVPYPSQMPGPHLVGCERCGFVTTKGPHDARCPRCQTALHRRKPNSIARTWALVITAFILYIPANVYPVMTVISFGSGQPDTILSGIRELFEAGMWPLALLVFFASITVPFLKLFGLIALLISVQIGARWRLRDRTVLYRVVESIGRWSMIDIFMISILVGLVRLGSIATIEPGVGATSFAAVVIITMIAATTFDPRLMWDAAGANGERAKGGLTHGG
ncbi:MAG TPA: paraquat-inducible protein A [Alphaproteobacteria bacterium]|nr:paraquat-inducible protein A [Alphaproteobacteria bacterium]